MTQTFAFTPQQTSPPFQFQPALDGAQYTCSVTWSLFGQRWVMTIKTVDGTLVLAIPMVGSPEGLALASLTYDGNLRRAVATLAAGRLPYRLGAIVPVTIAGAVTDAYNVADVQGLVTSPTTLTYPLPADPQMDATQAGALFRNISLTKGFFASTMVYRPSTAQIIVEP